jgi:hypothetical protein
MQILMILDLFLKIIFYDGVGYIPKERNYTNPRTLIPKEQGIPGSCGK